MSTSQSNPLPPVPTVQPLVQQQVLVTENWSRWFMNLRDKVNTINALVVSISGAGSTQASFDLLSPLTTTGDILTYSGGHNIRLPIGTAGQVLTVVGGLPAWQTFSGGSPLTTKGDIYTFGTANARLPVGTDGQVLVARSTATLGVDWETNSPTLPLTTTGDILTFKSGTGNVRLGVGTDGQVLTARSTATNGIDWETPTATTPANITPDTHPTTPNAADDEFEFGTTMDTSGARRSGATSWSNFGTITGTWNLSQGSLFYQPVAISSNIYVGYTQPVPGSGAWAYTLRISTSNLTNNCVLGLFLGTSSGASGRIVSFGINLISSNISLTIAHWTNNTTFSSTTSSTSNFTPAALVSTIGPGTFPLYLRLSYDGTNLKFLVSILGVEGTYFQVYTETAASFIGTITTIGVGGQQGAVVTNIPFMACDWFRRTT